MPDNYHICLTLMITLYTYPIYLSVLILTEMMTKFHDISCSRPQVIDFPKGKNTVDAMTRQWLYKTQDIQRWCIGLLNFVA